MTLSKFPLQALVKLLHFVRFVEARSRRWRRDVTFGRLFYLAVMLTAVVLTAFFPFLRGVNRSWTSASSWRAAFWEGAWIIALVGLFLRYEKEFLRAFSKRKLPHAYETRMADLAGVVDRTASLNLKRPAEIDAYRTDVLRCVASGIADQLDLPLETLTANLLVLSGKQPETMIVKARSNALRPTGREHVVDEDLLMWRAIGSGGIEVENDFRRLKPELKKPYRSIVAIPVTKDGMAYGGLSIDCTTAYAFYGHRRLIFCQVRPYVAHLALTFGPGSPYHECRFYPPHTG
jgi:hypothetical protein